MAAIKYYPLVISEIIRAGIFCNNISIDNYLSGQATVNGLFGFMETLLKHKKQSFSMTISMITELF